MLRMAYVGTCQDGLLQNAPFMNQRYIDSGNQVDLQVLAQRSLGWTFGCPLHSTLLLWGERGARSEMFGLLFSLFLFPALCAPCADGLLPCFVCRGLPVVLCYPFWGEGSPTKID